ncbi:MAG: 3-phosphoshikimate 1-carboxyvinyltransferase, partial [Oscillospiraceae bacterium]|nr:3-phosphoshikimate 1-carboxyvinyltransferase [Oscillospiraceae bacterium]
MNRKAPVNRILLPGERFGSVRIPSSKSAAHRVLICAAFGGRPVAVRLSGLSQDILATANCLRALGAGVRQNDQGLEIRPLDRNPDLREALLPAGESGSTLRFLLPLAGALGRKAVFRMEGRLSRRPLAPLDAVLREHGMSVEQDGDRLLCSGQLRSGEYALAGNISSQYFSGLLMALPLLEGSSTLSACGKLESAGYVRMTEQILESSGVKLEKLPGLRWHIPGGQHPQLPETVQVEGDWSNAAFFLCMGALSEKGVRVDG